MSILLDVKNLRVDLPTERGMLHAVRGIDFHVRRGEMLCLVGESGCGKSMTSLALMGLLPARARRSADRLQFDGIDLQAQDERGMSRLRGARMSMIFQEPMTSLNPVFTAGEQIAESIRVHQGKDRAAARAEALRMLELVRIPEARNVLDRFPHQLSGGMRQRVMIAMALSCKPQLLIADEPTTALDVTVQRQVLLLLREKARARGTAILLITHDMALVSQFCDRVYVMYAGGIVEQGITATVMQAPQHPYTQGLLACLPEKAVPGSDLASIPGQVPNLAQLPGGCTFKDRCARRHGRCETRPPLLATATPDHLSACWLQAEDAPA